MSAGYVIESFGKIRVRKPVLPNGCASCDYAIKCASPVREAFDEVRQLPGVYVADTNTVGFSSEVLQQEPHLSAINNFDIVSGALRNILANCGNGATDVYENGQYVGMRCGSNGEIIK